MVFKTGSMLETAGAVDNALLLAEHQVDLDLYLELFC